MLGVQGRVRNGKKPENTMTKLVLGQCPVVSPLVNQPQIKEIKGRKEEFFSRIEN